MTKQEYEESLKSLHEYGQLSTNWGGNGEVSASEKQIACCEAILGTLGKAPEINMCHRGNLYLVYNPSDDEEISIIITYSAVLVTVVKNNSVHLAYEMDIDDMEEICNRVNSIVENEWGYLNYRRRMGFDD